MSRFPDTVYSRTVNSLTCDVDGCDDPPAVVVTSMTSGNRRFVCRRCAEELTARGVAWRSR